MKKIAVISTNDDPNYLFYLPMVVEGWYKLGYDVHVMSTAINQDILNTILSVFDNHLNEAYPDRQAVMITWTPIEGIDLVTQVQCARLFAAHSRYKYDPQTRFITSDIDMLVLKDIFEPKGQIDTWGHDLTGFRQQPICYVSMTSERWIEVMGIDLNESLEANMERIIKAEPMHATHEKWCTDQEIITKKLQAVPFYYRHDRGIEQGSFLPKGRLDRYDWKRPTEIIDVHLPRNPLAHYGELEQLAGSWFREYFENFKACVNGKQPA